MQQVFDLDLYLLLPLALVLFLMALPILSRKLYGKVNYVTPFDFMKRLDAGDTVVILDLRPEKDFDRGHIDGSTNLPFRDLVDRVGARNAGFLAYKDHAIALICESDLKSIRAAKELRRRGFLDVSVVKGGIHRWKRENLPLGS